MPDHTIFLSEAKVTDLEVEYGVRAMRYGWVAPAGPELDEFEREVAERVDYYWVPVNSRDLNYSNYFEVCDLAESRFDDHHSHNTVRLDVPGVTRLLTPLPYVRSERGRG